MTSSLGHHLNHRDVIVARSTAPGEGAIAIVRLDGEGVAPLLRRLFIPQGRRHPVDYPRRLIFGQWIDPNAESADGLIDEGMTVFFRGPRSYTGHDLAELHCHGGAVVVRRLIEAAVSLGARPAAPGEFTRRAYLNGRLDLAQAEAVAELIQAQTTAALRLAQRQLAGGLSRLVEGLRQTLIELAAEIEARIDFPEEGIEPAEAARLLAQFVDIAEGVARLRASGRRGRLLREGAHLAIVGPPNVGKSSLMNALAREDRAIVTPEPGTTRDTVECRIDLEGIPVTLIDTAGLREADDVVERLGVERTRRAIAEADAIVEVRDATGGIPPLAGPLARPPDLIVENKIDLVPPPRPEITPSPNAPPRLFLSALTGEGIERLEATLAALFLGEGASRCLGGEADDVPIGERHDALLARAETALAEARGAWEAGLGGELAMIDLREALAALDEVIGLSADEAVLDRIFERFCLGK